MSLDVTLAPSRNFTWARPCFSRAALSFPRLSLSFSSSVTLVLPDIGAFSFLVVGTFVLVPSLALLLHLTDVLTLVLDNAVPGPLPPRGTNLGTGGLSG